MKKNLCILFAFILGCSSILANIYEKNDSLTSRKDNQKKICIHKYLTTCQTNPQPPGLGDFLRGTIALFEFSKTYDYQLFIDSDIHPLFGFLEENENFIKNNHDTEVHELIPGSNYSSYDSIYQSLQSLFKSNESFSLITNSFYTTTTNGLKNFGPITEECRSFLKDILTPNEELQHDVKKVCDYMNLDLEKGFTVIHLRFGDKFLNSDGYDRRKLNSINYKLKTLINKNKDIQYVLFSDSSTMAKKLKEGNPSLHYWDNKKIHLGDLRNDPEGIKDTLIDFFIMSKCDVIYSLNLSGFSLVISLIYDKEYRVIR